MIEQHELHRSTYMHIFLNKYIRKNFGDFQQLEKTFFSQAYFIERIKYKIHLTHTLCVNQLYVIHKPHQQMLLTEFLAS